jgi:hypothetical protein
MPRNPFSVPSKPSRQIIHQIEIQLTAFLRTLMSHPTFSTHELLWEFMLVQDLSRQQCIDRCRGKLESKKELQYEDFIVYTSGDLEAIEVFLTHAAEETGRVSLGLQKVARIVLLLQNNMFDMAESLEIFDEKLAEVEFLKPVYEHVLQRDFLSASTVQDHALTIFAHEMISTVGMSEAVLTALSQPIGLIHELKREEALLAKSQATLVKLNGKNGWPLGMFEEKRERDIKGAQDRVYTAQNTIRRLSNDIKYAHISLASELGGFHRAQQGELERAIEAYTMGMIRAEKERLQRLQRLLTRYGAFYDGQAHHKPEDVLEDNEDSDEPDQTTYEDLDGQHEVPDGHLAEPLVNGAVPEDT